MKTYKVHQAYINGNGKVIVAGEYNETEVDLAEARAKSIITLNSSNLQTVVVEKPDEITIKKFNITNDILKITLEASMKNIKIQSIKINSTSYESIEQIKYVSSKTARKVIEIRDIKRFINYEDINKRVPLAMSRKWEDVTSLDFEYIQPTINSPIVTRT